jgi:hypothetical protein
MIMVAKLQTSTIQNYVENIQTNYFGVMRRFPQLQMAAETLNDLFDQLFTQRVVPKSDELWQQESLRLLFGVFSSWLHSFVMSSTGLGEHGLTSIRRSIEFTCYISKIKESNERAQLWVERRDNIDNKRKFALQFGIPRAYFTDQYAHLKQLLVYYDHASDFGAHGNFATLATKWREGKQSFTMSIHDDPKTVPVSTGVIVELGSTILKSLLIDLKPLITEHDQFFANVSAFGVMLKKAKLELAEYEYPNGISPEIRKAIDTPDETIFDDQFEELKKTFGAIAHNKQNNDARK